jgi:two-component system, OmpR family, sensor kinase
VLSLRARVLVGAAVIALVLAVGAVVTIRTTRQHLLEQVDDRLLATNARDLGFGPGPGGPPRFSELYVGVVQGDGVRTVLASNPAGDENPRPEIDVDALRSDRLFTVRAESGDLRYRVRTISLGRSGGTGVLALPLDTVDDATGRLLAVAVGTTAVALGVVALVAWWVVHLGVRPIKRMTAAASAIAAGNLSQRVPEPAAGTEAGDLGQALNTMLGRIEEAFDERTRSEERLRQFVADASHELRTPVTTIRGYAELYRGGGLDDPTELEEAMRRTEQESVRMGRLVDDLLQLARLDQGRPLVQQPVDLAAVVADAGRDARAVAPERAITVDADGPLVVIGDEDRLRQVVANVVGNALVHTEAGTAIEVRAARRDGSARIEVTDHGDGMDPEVAARAFERFFRADPSRSRHRGGSGLGLSIVQAVVGAHGGTVALDTAAGSGTTVVIEVPLADPG